MSHSPRAVVLGTGPSLHAALELGLDMSSVLTVGVNDILRYVPYCQHVFQINAPHQIPKHYWPYIDHDLPATFWFKAIDQWRNRFPEGQHIETDPDGVGMSMDLFSKMRSMDPPIIPMWRTSPTAAIGLAWWLGANEIGLLGVDLKDHPDLKHDLHMTVGFFRRIGQSIDVAGGRLVNLADEELTAVQCLPFEDPFEWCNA